MTDPEGTIVEQTLRIRAQPATVWRYWTDPARLREWWGAATTLEAQPGGAYVIEMATGQVMRGAFIELVPHERIVFSFGWDPADNTPDLPPGSSLVEVTLTPDGDETVLDLRHTGLSPSLAEQHRGGWGHFLPLLATAASEEVGTP